MTTNIIGFPTRRSRLFASDKMRGPSSAI